MTKYVIRKNGQVFAEVDEPESFDNRKHEELRLLFNASVGDIAFFKNQQWKVANYTLLLDGALVTLSFTYHLELRYIVAVSVGKLFCTWLILNALENSIEVKRKRMNLCCELFTPRFREIRQSTKSSHWFQSLFWQLSVVVMVAFVTVMFLVTHCAVGRSWQ